MSNSQQEQLFDESMFEENFKPDTPPSTEKSYEKDLYKKDAWVWQAYGKYQNYLRAKARNGGRDFKQRRN